MPTISQTDRLLRAPRPWLTDGGLETTLVFHDGYDLPMFAAWPLVRTEQGRETLRRYFRRYVEIAREAGTGFVLDTPTWRAGAAWAEALGVTTAEIAEANRRSVALAREISSEFPDTPIVINGAVGPAGDGYSPEHLLTPDREQAIHAPQIEALAAAGADLVSAVTMTHAGEAIGLVRAAVAAGIPCVVSFTVETDGRLPDGAAISDAIARVDAATDGAPIWYMINCAHPDHFRGALERGAAWLSRIGGVRANASRMSHAELDEAEELDDGNPQEFGELHAELARILPALKVLGGCCGTDHRHVGCVAHAVLPERADA